MSALSKVISSEEVRKRAATLSAESVRPVRPMFRRNGFDVNQIVPITGDMEKDIWDDMDIYLNKDTEATNSEEDPLALSITSLFSFEPSTTSATKVLECQTPLLPSTVNTVSSSAIEMTSEKSPQAQECTTEADETIKGACLNASNSQHDKMNCHGACTPSKYPEEKGGYSPYSSPSTPFGSSSVSDMSEVFDDDMTDFSDDSKETIITAATFSSEISDEELVMLTVRELNKKLKKFSRSDILRYKQRRRLLKNRGYAQKCRTRRVQQYKTLSEDNSELYKQIDDLREMVSLYQKQRDEYRSKYAKLKSKFNSMSCTQQLL